MDVFITGASGYVGSEVATAFARAGHCVHGLVRSAAKCRALQDAFTASCGAHATEVHILRSHSMLWVSVPEHSPPNKVHRHLGGDVYWVFTRGQGLFHRIGLKSGFETIAIEIKDDNPFHLISSACHMWYQPVNTGDGPLEYLMVHEPSYEASEELELAKDECPSEWGFRFE